MAAKVIQLKGPSRLEEFLEHFRRDEAAGVVTDAVLIYRIERNGEAGTVSKWWGQTSSVLCAGLCAVMQDKILDYIKGTEDEEF